MKWRARFTRTAEDDLREILLYALEHYDAQRASALLDSFEQARASLETMPFRCDPPEELKKVNVFDYREIHLPPYRMIYEPDKTSGIVHIHAVLHSRRNIADILTPRLFGESGE